MPVPYTELTGLKGDTAHEKVENLLHDAVQYVDEEDKRTDFLDKIFLHPVLGLVSLAVMMFIVFQAVFLGQRRLWMGLKPSLAGWVKPSVGLLAILYLTVWW